MGLSKAKILIIDDIEEHGKKIADALWKSGRHVLFVHYSEQSLMDKSYGVHSGVRAVFLDIDLAGAGITGGGSHLYTPAEKALSILLDDNNGPYVLITWSSHDDKAEGLYKHLRLRLPEGKRPVSLTQMNKEEFIHGEGNEENIKTAVIDNLSKHNSLRCLTEWEGHVQNSSSEIVKNLSAIADKQENNCFDKNLEQLLLQLARAEAGKWLSKTDDIASPLYSLMSVLLGDRLSYITPDSYSISNEPIEALNKQEIIKWKCKINTFLHFDNSTPPESVPGSLFNYPINNSDISLPIIKSEEKMYSFIRGYFLDIRQGFKEYDNRVEISKKCKLVLMDITPPCDHSNKKVLWRRFVVACKVPIQYIEYLWRIDCEKKERITRSLKGDHLRLSPEFSLDNEEFVLVFNANLQGSIQEPTNSSDWKQYLGDRKGRMREQLLSDLMGWLGSHITRGGYVALSPDVTEYSTDTQKDKKTSNSRFNNPKIKPIVIKRKWGYGFLKRKRKIQ